MVSSMLRVSPLETRPNSITFKLEPMSAAYLRQGRPMDPKKLVCFHFVGSRILTHTKNCPDGFPKGMYNPFIPVLVAQRMSIHIWVWYLKCLKGHLRNHWKLWGTSSRCWGSFRSLSRLRSWTQTSCAGMGGSGNLRGEHQKQILATKKA